MEDNMAPKAKYIPWVLALILLIIVVVSVNELFQTQSTNKILQTANNELTVQQEVLQDTIDSKDIYIKEIRKDREVIQERRKNREGEFEKIDEDYETVIHTIANDDDDAHFRAITGIIRQHTRKRSKSN